MMPGTILQILFSSFILLALTGSVPAQLSQATPPEEDSLSWYIQMKYGLDQELINGFQYDKRNVQYKGDPFFPDDHFYKGSVTLEGITYDDVQLKYDSYSQQLILGYNDFKKQYNQLIINNIQVDSFSLGTYRFKHIALSDPRMLFYQVFEAGPVTCYIHWKRDIHATHDDLQYSHEYTVPIGTFYIGYMGKIHPVTNRKSFILVFPDTLQPEIKRYFRQQQLRLREVGPKEIQSLLNFIGDLSEPIPRQ
jgi:hypothetical protein